MSYILLIEIAATSFGAYAGHHQAKIFLYKLMPVGNDM